MAIMLKGAIVLISLLSVCIGAADDGMAAAKKRRASTPAGSYAAPYAYGNQPFQTRDVSGNAEQERLQRLYRDIERYNSAPLITGGGY